MCAHVCCGQTYLRFVCQGGSMYVPPARRSVFGLADWKKMKWIRRGLTPKQVWLSPKSSFNDLQSMLFCSAKKMCSALWI